MVRPEASGNPDPFGSELVLLYSVHFGSAISMLSPPNVPPRKLRESRNPTGVYWYAAQSPSTDGHLLVSRLSLSLFPQNRIRLSREDARRFACPIGFHYRSGLGGDW